MSMSLPWRDGAVRVKDFASRGGVADLKDARLPGGGAVNWLKSGAQKGNLRTRERSGS